MKNHLVFALLFLLLPAILCGCAATSGSAPKDTSAVNTTEAEPQETEPPGPIKATTDISELDPSLDYSASAEELFTFCSSDSEYNIIQGGYFDGEHYYIASLHRDENSYEVARILELDASGNILRESEPLPLDHANNITYNSKLKLLVVSHCHSPEGHYGRYSMVDPTDFSIVKTADLSVTFFSMAYSPERDAYASGEWSGETLDTWDGNLRPAFYSHVDPPGSLSQGVFCDGNYIYFVRSSQNGFGSEIRIYNWELELVRTVPLMLSDSIEPESINIVNGEVYIVGNDWNVGCGVAFRLTFNVTEESGTTNTLSE